MIPLAAIAFLKGAGLFVLDCARPFANPWSWPGLMLVAALAFCKGDAYRDEIWKTRIAKERAAQEEAIRKQDEETFKIIDRLVTEKEERNARIQKLLGELAADGSLKRGALSPSVVRAINRALSGRP